jgi:hypothetical protein
MTTPAEIAGTPRRVKRAKWVNVLAGVNIVIVVAALLATWTGNVLLAIIGMLARPLVLLFMQQPVIAIVVSIGLILFAAALAAARGAPGDRGWLFWKYGTIILSVGLVAGQLSVLVVLAL